MSANSKIEWCDHTFNPWIGCMRVSPGCDNCYAAVSTPARTMHVAWGAAEPRHRTGAGNWAMPKIWNGGHDAFFAKHGRRQRVFCASLADVFDNSVDPQWRADLFQLIEQTPKLDWLLLTKRIGNVANMVPEATDLIDYGEGWQSMWGQGVWPENVWLGATIVNQEEADRDIPKLLRVPAAKHFLSMEPLIGPVDLTRIDTDTCASECCGMQRFNALTGESICDLSEEAFDHDPAIDWVIVGGESGPHARPMHPDWARSIRDQCAAAGVPFLFKQWGEHIVPEGGEQACRVCGCTQNNACPGGCWWLEEDLCSACFDQPVPINGRAVRYRRVGKKPAGRLLDGIAHNGFPS